MIMIIIIITIIITILNEDMIVAVVICNLSKCK